FSADLAGSESKEVSRLMPSNQEPNNPDQQQRKGDNNDLENLGMDELLEVYQRKMATFSEGDIVRGKVLKVTPGEVVVDIGYKSEGILPASEVTDYKGTVTVKPGEDIDVFIERLESANGYIALSREKAERMLVW